MPLPQNRGSRGRVVIWDGDPLELSSAPERVFIDGVDIRDYPLAQLRESIGYVPQETFLFSDSVKGNIAFGVEKAEMADIEWAAEIAGLSEDIAEFPDRFEALVGERGITLSGGQKQRTAIARAVLREPKILILDDALSPVDTKIVLRSCDLPIPTEKPSSSVSSYRVTSSATGRPSR